MNPEVQQANPEPSAPPVPVETKPEPTPRELYQRAYNQREQIFARMQDGERLRRARLRGLFGPSVEPTHDELVIAAPLPEDKVRLIRVATDRHGLPALPKSRGRRRPHMTKQAQGIKSASIQVFRTLFQTHITTLAAAAKEKDEQFNGVPNDDLPKLGAAAAIAGARIAKARRKSKRVADRLRQELSRKINYGLVPGNINVAKYIN